MDKNDIMRSLKQQYNSVKSEGYDIFFIALCGDQNYGFEKNNTDSIDSITIVIPTKQDLLYGEKIFTSLKTQQGLVRIVDVRTFKEYLYEGHLDYIQILFSEYTHTSKKFKLYKDYLNKISNKIPYMNKLVLLQGLYKCGGIYYRNFSRTELAYSEQLLGKLIMLGCIADNILNNMDFPDALQTFKQCDEDLKNVITKCFNSEYSYKEAKKLNEWAFTKFGNLFYDVTPKDRNIDSITLSKLENLVNKLCLSNLGIYNTKNNINIEKYNNVFFISDTHFGHKNILKYEPGRLKLIGEELDEDKLDEYIILHDTTLIDNWNKAVTDKDLVFILGDFSFYGPEKTMEILNRLNGDKVLIIGNHDCNYLNKLMFDKTLFKMVADYYEFNHLGIKICLSHYPMLSWNGSNYGSVCLFGHIHSSPMDIPRHSYNVGVDANSYRPIPIDTAVNMALLNTDGISNSIVKDY